MTSIRRRGAAPLRRLTIELEGDGGTIDGVDELELPHGGADFVRLQRPEEVPLDVGGQSGGLRDALLHPVLAEAPQARLVRLVQAL